MLRDVARAIREEIVNLEVTGQLIEDRIESEINYRLRESLGRIADNLEASNG